MRTRAHLTLLSLVMMMLFVLVAVVPPSDASGRGGGRGGGGHHGGWQRSGWNRGGWHGGFWGPSVFIGGPFWYPGPYAYPYRCMRRCTRRRSMSPRLSRSPCHRRPTSSRDRPRTGTTARTARYYPYVRTAPVSGAGRPGRARPRRSRGDRDHDQPREDHDSGEEPARRPGLPQDRCRAAPPRRPHLARATT